MTFRDYTWDNGTGKQGPLREGKEIEFLGYGTERRHQITACWTTERKVQSSGKPKQLEFLE